MASNLANMIASAFGTNAKPVLSSPSRSAPVDDKFERHLEAQEPARQETPASNQPATTEAKPTAQTNTAPAETPVVEATATDDVENEEGAATGETSLADTLLAALSALGINTEGLGEGQKITDPAALKDIEEALGELAQLLGMDVKSLMQQLAQLAQPTGGSAGIEAGIDLAGKLSAWLGERLGTAAGAPLPAGVEEGFNKLLAGLEQLAKPVPTQPSLASAELKLPEPVLSAPTTAAEPAAKPAPEMKVERDALQRAEPTKDADPAEAPQKAQANNQQQAAARPAQEQAAPAPTAPATQQSSATPNQVDAAATPRIVQTGYQTSQQQLNLPQLAFEMSRQVQDGNTRFQIRLDPPELGRIEVKLDIDNRGQVHAKLVVEKAETLDLMQRDQRALEKALQQAGLDQSKTNLEFSLKQNPFAGDQNQRSDGERFGSANGSEDGDDAETPAPSITLYRGSLQASGVNIIA